MKEPPSKPPPIWNHFSNLHMFPLFDSLTIYSFWFLSKQSVDCVIISSVLSPSFYSSICSALLHVAHLFKLYNRHRNGFLAAWLDKRKQGKKKEKKIVSPSGCWLWLAAHDVSYGVVYPQLR